MSMLVAFCDLEFCPVSYDFITWLARAMLEREREKCERLHVVLVPHELGLGGFSRNWGEYDEAAARWRLLHIVVPACALAGATVSLMPTRGAAEMFSAREMIGWWPNGKAHFMAPLVDAARAGEKIPRLRATEQARRYVRHWRGKIKRPYVTLTIREQATDPSRNSNLPEWQKLFESFKGTYAAIRLADTHVALGDAAGNFAEIDIDLRLALYEQAAMNFIGNNGPQELLKFSDAPYRAFLDKGWPEHWEQHFHMKTGEQCPWSGPEQRLVYLPDTFENMRNAWEGIRAGSISG